MPLTRARVFPPVVTTIPPPPTVHQSFIAKTLKICNQIRIFYYIIRISTEKNEKRKCSVWWKWQLASTKSLYTGFYWFSSKLLNPEPWKSLKLQTNKRNRLSAKHFLPESRFPVPFCCVRHLLPSSTIFLNLLLSLSLSFSLSPFQYWREFY